mmetsp:Transcript_3717/g.10765  ORF Transcript_3717/g.10765 Transcript_3717/m.10765 type:complete len:210 (+) Transcript_3717:497-1126(+)
MTSPTALQPICLAPSDIMSPVRYPWSRTCVTDASNLSATCGSLRPYLHSMAADSTIAIGLATSCPAMSGAEPCTGSNTPGPSLDMLAEGSMPRLPVSMLAASDRMSPKMLPVTMVSNDLGLRMICIAALSTYMWDSSTSGYSFPMRVTTSRHSWLTSSTLLLSTLHRRPPRFWALSNATRAIRSTSGSEYTMVLKPVLLPCSSFPKPLG